MSLNAKRKLGIIGGTIPKPTFTKCLADYWSIIHSVIVAWLLNTISSTLRATVSYFEDVHEIMEASQRQILCL